MRQTTSGAEQNLEYHKGTHPLGIIPMEFYNWRYGHARFDVRAALSTIMQAIDLEGRPVVELPKMIRVLPGISPNSFRLGLLSNVLNCSY